MQILNPDGMDESGQAKYKKCVTKDAIEKGCFAENDERFNQTHLTPPMQSPVYEDFMGPQQCNNTDAFLHVHYN